MRRLIPALAACVVFVSPAFGQSQAMNGTIEGTVLDLGFKSELLMGPARSKPALFGGVPGANVATGCLCGPLSTCV